MDPYQKSGEQGRGDGAAYQYAVGQRGTGPGEIAPGGDIDGNIVGQVGTGQGAEADEIESGSLDNSVLAIGTLGQPLPLNWSKVMEP